MTIGTDTLAQDNFNRSNGALGGSTMSDGVNTWTTLSGSPTVASNKQSGNGSARVTSNTGFANANYSVQAEQYMKGDLSYNGGGVSGELRLYGRIVDSSNYYEAQISSNGGTNGEITVYINIVVSGTPTSLVNFAIEDDGYTTWRFDLDGTSLKLFGDGSQLLTTTDSTYTSTGYPGIASTGPIGTFSSDNFIVKGTSASSGVTVNATTDALVLTENAATISYDINISAGVDTLTLTEYSSDVVYGVNINATTAYLTLTEYSATVDTGSNDVEVIATTASLTLTEHTAFVEYPTFITASYDTLILTEHAATVATGASTLTNPGATSITYNGWTATVDVL